MTKKQRLADLKEDLVDAIAALDNAIEETLEAKKWEAKMRRNYSKAFNNYEQEKNG